MKKKPTYQDVVAELLTCREAMCAAMRVIAEIDLGSQLGIPAETRQQRFVDELHALGIQDGFGKRIDDVLRSALP
jgi:hypothetical protein